MAIEVRPATVFEDVRTLVGPKRADASVCWCLSYRIPSTINNKMRGQERGEPVGWAAVAPRADTTFARNRKIPHVDDLPVWSVWCIRVRPGYRGRGISHALIEGAVEFARDRGAPAIEAYPLDNKGAKVDLTMAYAGIRKNFEAAGFTHAADTTSVLAGHPRILMRRDLS